MRPNRLTRIEEQFGIIFWYKRMDKQIKVFRLNADKDGGSDELDSMDLTEPITKAEFNDFCTEWCDQHAS